jgi:heptosyltransferase II
MKSIMNGVFFKNVDSILLISLSCIGDVILTTPVMKTLKDNFPAAKLTVVAGPTSVPLLRRHELVDRIIVFENKGRHKGFGGLLKLLRELRGHRYSLAVDLRNTAFPYFLRCGYRITTHRAHLKNRGNIERHAIDRHLDVLEMSGIPITSHEMIVTVPRDVADKVAKFRVEKKLPEKDRLIAVYPGAGSPYKLYPPDKFVSALKSVAENGNYHFVLVGSQADREVCEAVSGAFPGRATNVAGELDILEVGALIQMCRLMVSNDSGPMHLSVAVGTPTVGIFGPTNAARYGPRGDRNRIVWRREPCNPCKSPECGRDSCIGDVPPEKIAEAVRALLGKYHA